MSPAAPVQTKANAARPARADGASVADTATAGTAGAARPLPHLEMIQRCFGRHDVTGVRAYIGGPAAEATRALGASAYASGDRVAFAAEPDLHTAAHEAAHVVQQRGGVQLQGGLGARGDRYEARADAVADLVVQGRSAEAMLAEDADPDTTTPTTPAVQRMKQGTEIAVASFDLPSGILGAHFDPDHGGVMGTPFKMVVRFATDVTDADGFGEYRQEIKGVFWRDGKVIEHRMVHGKIMQADAFQEDGDPSGFAYGHREHGPRENDWYQDGGEGVASTYYGLDTPQMTLAGNDFAKIGYHLTFRGSVIDTNRPDVPLLQREWQVIGGVHPHTVDRTPVPERENPLFRRHFTTRYKDLGGRLPGSRPTDPSAPVDPLSLFGAPSPEVPTTSQPPLPFSFGSPSATTQPAPSGSPPTPMPFSFPVPTTDPPSPTLTPLSFPTPSPTTDPPSATLMPFSFPAPTPTTPSPSSEPFAFSFLSPGETSEPKPGASPFAFSFAPTPSQGVGEQPEPHAPPRFELSKVTETPLRFTFEPEPKTEHMAFDFSTPTPSSPPKPQPVTISLRKPKPKVEKSAEQIRDEQNERRRKNLVPADALSYGGGEDFDHYHSDVELAKFASGFDPAIVREVLAAERHLLTHDPIPPFIERLALPLLSATADTVTVIVDGEPLMIVDADFYNELEDDFDDEEHD